MNHRRREKPTPPWPDLLPRLMRLAWPFLIAILACLGLALTSMEFLSAGRAAVSGESLWSKGQKSAVLHLSEYARSCRESDYAGFLSALAVPKGLRQARVAMSLDDPDLQAAREGLLLGQTHPQDIGRMIFFFTHFAEVDFIRQITDIWARGDELIDELDQAAQALQGVVSADCRDEPAKLAAMHAILQINERLTPMQLEFSQTVGQANRIVHEIAAAGLVGMTAILLVLGLWLSLRAQSRHAQADWRLAESEQRFALAVAGSRQGLWDLDIGSGELFISPEVEQILDMPQGSFGGHRQDFIVRLHPQERDAAVERLNELVAGGQSFEMELRVLDGRGQYRWVRAAGRALMARDGRASRVLGSLQDVSARRALEEALQQQMQSRDAAIQGLLRLLQSGVSAGSAAPPGQPARAGDPPAAGAQAGDALEEVSRLVTRLVQQLKRHGDHLDAIFALSPDGFVSFDEHGRINHVNAAFTRMTGLTEAAALGSTQDALERHLTTLMGQGLGPGLGSGLRPAIPSQDAPPKALLIHLQRPDERILALQWRQGASPAISRVLYLRDVTHEAEVERLKSEFLSTAAHELRTPMASIMGFSELLMTRDYPADRRAELLQTVHRQATRMSSIINELLDLARIEARAGKDFMVERLDFWALAEDAIRDLGTPAGRCTALRQKPAEPLWVYADRGKSIQALGNILSNAYKFSGEGDAVEVRPVHGTISEGVVVRSAVGIQVVDHGMGMTPEQLARAGQRFYRGDASGRIPGTGLGLSIVEEILKAQGGRLELSSAPGRGTIATLWLPCAEVGPRANQEANA